MCLISFSVYTTESDRMRVRKTYELIVFLGNGRANILKRFYKLYVAKPAQNPNSKTYDIHVEHDVSLDFDAVQHF